MTDAQKQAAVEVAVSQYDGGDLTVSKDHLGVIPSEEGVYVKAWILVRNYEIESWLEK